MCSLWIQSKGFHEYVYDGQCFNYLIDKSSPENRKVAGGYNLFFLVSVMSVKPFSKLINRILFMSQNWDQVTRLALMIGRGNEAILTWIGHIYLSYLH